MPSGFALLPPSYNPQQISEESTVANAALVSGTKNSQRVQAQNVEPSCTIPAVINSGQIPRATQHLQLQFPKNRQAHSDFPDRGSSPAAFVPASESFTTDSYLGRDKGFSVLEHEPREPRSLLGDNLFAAIQAFEARC